MNHAHQQSQICTRLSLNQEAREKIQKALFDDEQDMAFVLDTLTNNEEELKRARELQGSKSRLLQDLLQLVGHFLMGRDHTYTRTGS